MVMERLGILEARLTSLLQQLREARERNKVLEEKVRELEAEAAENAGKASSHDARLRDLSIENERLRARQEASRLRVEQLLGVLSTIPGLRQRRARLKRAEG
ncbi:MAG: hypothetical protein ACE5LX_06520 [Nitrospinota bacterium]